MKTKKEGIIVCCFEVSKEGVLYIMKCWEIKDCPFKDTDFRDSKCPSFKLQINCWEYDWVSFYQAMPDCEGKLEWRDVMLTECPNCFVCSLHRDAISKIVKGLENAAPAK